MSVLGAPQGLFDLYDSDVCVGSMIQKRDVMAILGVTEEDLADLPFVTWNGVPAIDERKLQKLWYADAIPNTPPSRIGGGKVSLDETILVALMKLAYPDAVVEQQVRWGRKRVDLRVTFGGDQRMVEFEGPWHYEPSPRNPSPPDPSERWDAIANFFGVECVPWPYWIQRCTSNVRALFEPNTAGLGALWSTKTHFGSFLFPNAADLILRVNERFGALRSGGCGYFYGPNTEGRTNPEHPIVEAIAKERKPVATLLPKGHGDPRAWLPDRLWSP